MKKELGLDALGVQKVMHGSDYAFDAVGQFAANTITLLTGQMTYFYTNKAGVAAATAGTILLIAKIIDAFTDLIMGKLLMKTNSKYGKARPWFLRMIFPTMVAIIALFTMPHLSDTGMLIYGVITNVLVSAVCYTAIMCAYNALMAYKTKSNEEQGKMGVCRCAVGYGVGIVLGIGLIPITNALGGDQRAWIIFAAILAVLSGLALFIVFKTSKELYLESVDASVAENEVSIMRALEILIHNKYWIKITIGGIFVNVMYSMVMAAPLYYANYIVGDEGFYSIINTVYIIPSILGFLTAPILMRKFGLTNTFRIACVIGVIGGAVRCVAPANVMISLIFGSVVMYSTVPLISALPAMTVNTAEINMDQYGMRIIPMTNATNSFVGKIGNGVGSASLGWVLALGGFITGGSAAEQPDTIIPAIYALNIYIPMAMLILCVVLFLNYDLDKRYEALLKSNAEKEAANKRG